MWGYGHMYGWGPFIGFGWILQLIFWVVIIWLIVALVRHHKDEHYRKDAKESDALKILKERYAKGEITKEQFEQMKSDLQ